MLCEDQREEEEDGRRQERCRDAGRGRKGREGYRETGKEGKRSEKKKVCHFSRQPPGKELPKRQEATLRLVDSKNPST